MRFRKGIIQVKAAAISVSALWRSSCERVKAKWRELDIRSKLGIAATAAWLMLFLLPAMWHLLEATFTATELMPLNEWGDFLAGIFAPLAFFWLVLGYYQQGEELRQNTEALQLQQQEMKASADATAKLAATAMADHQRQQRILDGQNRIKFSARLDYERSNISDSAGLLSGIMNARGSSILINSIAALPKNLNISSPLSFVWLTSIRDGEYRLEVPPPGALSPEGPHGGIADLYTPDFPIELEITYLNNLNEEKLVRASWDSLWSIDFGTENEKYSLE